MPIGIVIEYAAIANSLEAQERLNNLTDALAAGSRKFRQGAVMSYIRGLEKQASNTGESRHIPSVSSDPTSFEATATVSEFGIEVVRGKVNG